VEWRTLGEVCEIKTGSKPEKIFDKINSYEYINAGTTNSGFTEIYNCDGDTVTTPSRGQGGIGFVGYQKDNFFLGPLCYKIKPLNKTIVLTKYIFYYLQSNNDLIFKIKNEGGVPSVNRIDLIKLLVAIPSLAKQERIVAILDRFDTLCNDISAGLPAEIAARQKQYEYYRDKLLTFKEFT
jgi:type I restriction enzyme S subunit